MKVTRWFGNIEVTVEKSSGDLRFTVIVPFRQIEGNGSNYEYRLGWLKDCAGHINAAAAWLESMKDPAIWEALLAEGHKVS